MEARYCRKVAGMILTLSSVLTLSALVEAQRETGSLQGTITETGGAAITGAKVTVKSAGTGATRETTTGPSGLYAVTLLPPGSYDVTVAATNFTSQTHRVQVPLGDTFTLDVKLTQQTPPAPKSTSPPPVEYKIPPEAARQVNPVKPTAESLAEGKRWYGYDCAMCHGEKGDGKGDLAANMKTKLSDFTDPDVLKSTTDGELFYIVANGKGEMPPEGKRLQPNGIWNLVNYIRSLAKK